MSGTATYEPLDGLRHRHGRVEHEHPHTGPHEHEHDHPEDHGYSHGLDHHSINARGRASVPS